MKKLLFTLSVFALLLITSCGKDDEVQVDIGVSGNLVFDGNEIVITDGLYGEISEGGEYAATFFLSDAPISFNAETEQANFQGDYLINVIIYSQSESFESGNYNVATLDGEVSDKSSFVVVADVNNASSGGVLAVDGTVNIQKSGDVFTLTFAIDFEGDTELTGNATGNFEVVDIQ
ncbi:hypothetical protein [Ekhidna sp.]|uniref:hypothetical protein n=1 Tax=Ekhidna sp. TaxID=2608089 RepID=UPI003BAA2ED1